MIRGAVSTATAPGSVALYEGASEASGVLLEGSVGRVKIPTMARA